MILSFRVRKCSKKWEGCILPHSWDAQKISTLCKKVSHIPICFAFFAFLVFIGGVPMNLFGKCQKKADYVVTGTWGDKAAKDATK